MASSSDIPTVYVQNLEERVKLDTLTQALRTVFEQFGNVVDVVAKKNFKAKGQAFIVFETHESALAAIDDVQGFELFGKPMRVALARTPSDKTIELQGDGDNLQAHRRHRLAEKDKRKTLAAAQEQRQLKTGTQNTIDNRTSKISKPSGLKSTGPSGSTAVPDEYLPPNKILFLQNLGEEVGIETLSATFSRFDGFREVRLVPGRRGIAFVEYEAEQGAIAAKESLAGMLFGEKQIKVTYQRQ